VRAGYRSTLITKLFFEERGLHSRYQTTEKIAFCPAMGTETQDYLCLYTNSADCSIMIAPDTGYVGIGNDYPSNLLHLTDGGSNELAMRVQAGTGNTGGAWTGIGFSGEWLNTKGGILFQSAGTSYSRGNMIFALNNTSDESSVTPSDAVMTLTPNGNVGIGTMAPQANLDVYGSSADIHVDAYGGLKGYSSGSFIWGLKRFDDGYDKLAIMSNDTISLFNNASNPGSPGSPAMTLKNGNVGIGTPTPQMLVDIEGGDVSVNGGGWDEQVLNIGSSSGHADVGLSLLSMLDWNIVNSTSDNNNLYFMSETNGYAPLITFTQTGSVGIGTIAPGSLLQVNGGAAIGYSASTAAPSNGLAVSGMLRLKA
jgi:hypothetical protein